LWIGQVFVEALADAVAPLLLRKKMIARVFFAAFAAGDDVLNALHFFEAFIESDKAGFAALTVLQNMEQAFDCLGAGGAGSLLPIKNCYALERTV
jgi:hypothetical protein